MRIKGNRPMVEGENKAINQRVHIGFIGYMSCGKPVCVECGDAK